MIITCPCEKKKFKIDAALIPNNGRNLQCGSCKRIWFFKIENNNLAPLSPSESLSNNETDINIEKNEIETPIKIIESINSNKVEKEEKKPKKILEKKKPLTKERKEENKDGKFFSNLLVVIISFVAFIILLDTLKTPLINIFPRLEIILFNLFETLKDIKLFIIDLS